MKKERDYEFIFRAIYFATTFLILCKEIFLLYVIYSLFPVLSSGPGSESGWHKLFIQVLVISMILFISGVVQLILTVVLIIKTMKGIDSKSTRNLILITGVFEIITGGILGLIIGVINIVFFIIIRKKMRNFNKEDELDIPTEI